MIRWTDVYKSYGATEALAGVDLTIVQGECAVLIGPSGCGKSTLLKTVNRMTEPDRGIVEVESVPVDRYRPEELRRKIGYCIQGVGLFPHFTVEENIAVVPRLLHWPEEKIRERIRFLLELAGLPNGYKAKRPRELSGGEAQRVGVCRALAADPPILLMDEPFGAVDPLTRDTLQLAFRSIQKELKKTVLFVTHDVEEAILLGDRILVMNQGRIEGAGTPESFVRPGVPAFVRRFLGDEYPLRILRRYVASDLDLPATLPDGKEVKMDRVASPHSFAVLSPDANLKEVLAELLRQESDRVAVDAGGGKQVLVGYGDMARLLREVAG